MTQLEFRGFLAGLELAVDILADTVLFEGQSLRDSGQRSPGRPEQAVSIIYLGFPRKTFSRHRELQR